MVISINQKTRRKFMQPNLGNNVMSQPGSRYPTMGNQAVITPGGNNNNTTVRRGNNGRNNVYAAPQTPHYAAAPQQNHQWQAATPGGGNFFSNFFRTSYQPRPPAPPLFRPAAAVYVGQPDNQVHGRRWSLGNIIFDVLCLSAVIAFIFAITLAK